MVLLVIIGVFETEYFPSLNMSFGEIRHFRWLFSEAVWESGLKKCRNDRAVKI